MLINFEATCGTFDDRRVVKFEECCEEVFENKMVWWANNTTVPLGTMMVITVTTRDGMVYPLKWEITYPLAIKDAVWFTLRWVRGRPDATTVSINW
jgi:hypothetical protein